MKPKFLLLTLALCSVMALPATDYVMLSPLDTAVLPEIPTKDHGGDVVRSVLNKNGIW